MGSWHETCSLTNLPIYEDEKVVMVTFPERLFPTSMSISSFFVRAAIVEKGTYDEYGSLKELADKDGDSPRPGKEKLRAFFKKSVWDAVLKIKPQKDPHNFEQGRIDWLLQNDSIEAGMREKNRERFKTTLGEKAFEEAMKDPDVSRQMNPPTEIDVELAKIIRFMDKTRRTFITTPQGSDEEFDSYKLIHKIIEKEFGKLQKAYEQMME